MKRLFLSLIFASLGLFATTQAQTPAGYAIFGDVPYGYTNLRDQIEVSIPAVISGQDINSSSSVYAKPVNNNSISFTGQGLSGGHACQNYASLSIRFASAQTMTLTDNMTIHIKIKRADDKTSGLIRLSMIKGTWGAARLSFQIANNEITTSISEYVLSYQAPLTSFGVSTYNQAQLVGSSTNGTPVDVSYAGGNWNELFRFEAADGESFEITQIYIDADANTPDPVDPNECTDEDAPTLLTLAASNIQDKSVTLTASANDAASSISYEFFYKAEGDAEFTSAGTASAAPNTDATKVVKGLDPETNYTFKVVATDPCNNEAEFVKPEEVRTLALVERRYYFFRGDPASVSLPSEGVVSYDLREGVGTTVGNGGGFSHSQKKYYTNFANSNNSSWWSFNQNLSSAKDMSEISQAEWYLVVKFRTNISYGNFNIRLNNAVSYQNGQNLTYESDGTWNVLTLALADAKNTLTYSASQTGTVFQFHADGGAGYLDIAYAYLTNNAASVDDLVDNVAPVISSISDGDKTTSSVVLTVTASDDSGEDITYIVKENDDVLTSTPATGTSGAATTITVSELVGQNHTLTVIARDGAGNEASQNIVVTLVAADNPPTNLAVTTTNTDKSVTFTMYAEDDNSALTYAILDGSDNVLVSSIAGTAGENTVYTLKGLTPETAYSFKVRVTNSASLSTTSEVINITTAALAAQRYYLLRGDNSDIPSTGGLTSTLVNCNVTYSNNTFTKDTRIDKYLSQKTTSTWFALDVTPSETVENDIDDDWYLVVRFRTNMNNNVFFGNRLQFNFVSGGNNFNISNGEWITFNDGIWHTVSFRIGDHAGTLPPSYLTSGTLAFQLHIGSQVVAGEYLDIDYIYFTDDVTNVDEGTQFNKRIALNDAEDNTSVLSANNGQTVDIDLTRSLTNASYNTICLPFDLSAEQVETLFGAGTKIGKLHDARIKEGDELYLNFSFVNAMEAGVPYIIQPTTAVTTPMFLENVTISNTTQNSEFGGVNLIGVFNPTQIEQQSAEEHSILLLGANNQLSWPNTTANMKGMRAYFQTTSAIAHVARRAYFGFNETQTTTGIGDVQESQQAVKVLRDGRVLIIRNNEVYDIFGARIQ